jgi:flagellar motility protein MotE (MotC chaperone)
MSRTAKKGRRYLRLLPSVVVVGAGLLVLNASGLVHDAYAEGKDVAAADAIAPAPKPGNKDYADDQGQVASAAEVDVLTSLSKRRKELDARQAQIEAQANILAATEARVDAKIVQLKNLQSQIATLVAQRDAAQQKQMADLIKTYSAMKPRDAARIFDSLDESVLLPVAAGMKSDVLAPVLAAMTAEQAQKLTVRLANKLTLPATNAAPAPVAASSVTTAPAAAGPVNPAQANPVQANPPQANPAPPAKAGG